MVTKRLFLVLGGGAAVSALDLGTEVRAQTRLGSSIQQRDFLFWMDDAARAEARAAADTLLPALDAAASQDPVAARQLHAVSSRELRQRYKADEFANRVVQTRSALGAVR